MEILFLKSFLPEIFLSLSVLFSLLFNSYIATSTSYNFPLIDKESFFQTLFILSLCFVLGLNIDFGSSDMGNVFTNDLLSVNAKLVLILSVAFSLIIGQNYLLLSRINLFEFFSLVLLALLSLMALLSSTDLISIYICLEMQSLCFYILAAFNRYSAFSTESGLKYFVLGAFVSGIFLFGCSLLYGITGSTNLHTYCLLFSDNLPANFDLSIFFVGVLFLVVTLLFKATAAPFHIWSPDVYEGAPLNSTIVFVLVPKLVIFVVFFRLLYYSFFNFFNSFQVFFLLSGILSVFLGSILGLRQKRFKRLLIYSSISHVGFLLLGFSCGNFIGLTSLLYYLFFYILTNVLIWGCLVFFVQQTKKPLYLSDFSGLHKTHPFMAISLALGLFSLAGIPPLVGFSMKFFIFSSAINAGLYSISVLIILLSVIGSFYYLRVIKILYFEKNQNPLVFSQSISIFSELSAVLISISFFFLLFCFFNPDIFLLFFYKTVLGIGLISF